MAHEGRHVDVVVVVAADLTVAPLVYTGVLAAAAGSNTDEVTAAAPDAIP